MGRGWWSVVSGLWAYLRLGWPGLAVRGWWVGVRDWVGRWLRWQVARPLGASVCLTWLARQDPSTQHKASKRACELLLKRKAPKLGS